MLYCVNIIPQGYYYRLFMFNTFHLKHWINEVASRLRSSGRSLVRGFQCSPKVDHNAEFFVSIVRNQDLGCLLRGA
jgi:hypothetical protein